MKFTNINRSSPCNPARNKPRPAQARAADLHFGSEEYGIDILRFRRYGLRSRHYDRQRPEFIKGVINLRGIIVPSLTCASIQTGQHYYDETTS